MGVPVNNHEGALSERIVQEVSQIRAELARKRRTRAHRQSRSRHTELPPNYDAIQGSPNEVLHKIMTKYYSHSTHAMSSFYSSANKL